MNGPLDGIRIIELAGLGALPFGSLKLADMGASIVRVDRVGDVPADRTPRRHIAWTAAGNRSRSISRMPLASRRFCAWRPLPTCSRILSAGRDRTTRLGPDDVMARNPKIVYGRLTGWGQQGPLAPTAGHSLNYEAIRW